jgi:hypothetical protein
MSGWGDEEETKSVASNITESTQTSHTKGSEPERRQMIQQKAVVHQNQEEEKKSRFSDKPVMSKVVPKVKGSLSFKLTTMKVRTNQFATKFHNDLSVYLYPIEVVPEPAETYIYMKIMKTIHRSVDKVFNPYVLSGKTLLSKAQIPEDYSFNANINGEPYEITIKGSQHTFFRDNLAEFRRNEDHSLIHNLLNFIINDGFRSIKGLF